MTAGRASGGVRAGTPWPAYCCAILRDAQGRFLLEGRPRSARSAPGELTCFGGTRLTDEEPEACLRRELMEELAWSAGPLRFALRLVDSRGSEVAWFYEGAAPPMEAVRTRVPGHEAVWAAPEALAAIPLSPWHRAALSAFLGGHGLARISG